jgi:hypothetical protein
LTEKTKLKTSIYIPQEKKTRPRFEDLALANMEKERITRFESDKDHTNRLDRLSVEGLSEDQDPDQSESKDCYDECYKEISLKVQKKYQKLKKTLIDNNKTENSLDLDKSSDFGENQDNASPVTQALSPKKKYIIISEEFPDGEPDGGQDKSPSVGTPETRKSKSLQFYSTLIVTHQNSSKSALVYASVMDPSGSILLIPEKSLRALSTVIANLCQVRAKSRGFLKCRKTRSMTGSSSESSR